MRDRPRTKETKSKTSTRRQLARSISTSVATSADPARNSKQPRRCVALISEGRRKPCKRPHKRSQHGQKGDKRYTVLPRTEPSCTPELTGRQKSGEPAGASLTPGRTQAVHCCVLVESMHQPQQAAVRGADMVRQPPRRVRQGVQQRRPHSSLPNVGQRRERPRKDDECRGTRNDPKCRNWQHHSRLPRLLPRNTQRPVTQPSLAPRGRVCRHSEQGSC